MTEKDTALQQQNQKLAGQGAQLKEKDEQLSQQSGQIVTLVKMLISSGRVPISLRVSSGPHSDHHYYNCRHFPKSDYLRLVIETTELIHKWDFILIRTVSTSKKI